MVVTYLVMGLLTVVAFKCGAERPVSSWITTKVELLDFVGGILLWPIAIAVHLWKAAR